MDKFVKLGGSEDNCHCSMITVCTLKNCKGDDEYVIDFSETLTVFHGKMRVNTSIFTSKQVVIE
jgi:hypothetical protein